MRHRSFAALALLVSVAWLGVAVAQEDQEPTNTSAGGSTGRRVFVLNFPELYKVSGEVGVKGPIRQAALTAFRDVTVPPVARKDTTHLINAGTLTADGFTAVVLTLVGQLKADNARAGEVGAVLVPDEEVVVRAMDEQGQLLLPLEVKAQSGTGSPSYFASEQQRAPVAFPRYRVLLYNASDKAATVTVFAYLVN
jgi:hypothetical protein